MVLEFIKSLIILKKFNILIKMELALLKDFIPKEIFILAKLKELKDKIEDMEKVCSKYEEDLAIAFKNCGTLIKDAKKVLRLKQPYHRQFKIILSQRVPTNFVLQVDQTASIPFAAPQPQERDLIALVGRGLWALDISRRTQQARDEALQKMPERVTDLRINHLIHWLPIGFTLSEHFVDLAVFQYQPAHRFGCRIAV